MHFQDCGKMTLDLLNWQARRDRGIRESSEHSGEEWKADSIKIVYHYLRNHRTLFVDDLWTYLSKPPSPRALGAVMQHAARKGWMEQQKVGGCILARPSKASNGQLKAEWQSLIYEKKSI